MFVTDFRNRHIHGSLIIARFSAIRKGVCLHVGWLICEYIQYVFIGYVRFVNNDLVAVNQSNICTYVE